jgi:hypothetical protein
MDIGGILGAANSVSNSQGGGGMFDVTGRSQTARAGTKREKAGFVYDTFLGGGLGLWSKGGMFGPKGDDEGEDFNLEDFLVYKQLPDYPEADTARQDWASKLQDWGKDPNYGAIPMNWDEIWGTAKDRINRYYWGGVSDPGLAGKVRASAARRGASDSPALENQLGAMGQQEAIDMNELATTIGTKQAEMGETGRQNWLASMSNLASLKPSYMTSSGVSEAMQSYIQPEYTGANSSTDMISGLMSLFTKSQAQKESDTGIDALYKKYSDQYNPGGATMPTTAGGSVTNSNFNMGSLMDAYNKYSTYN